MYLGRIFDGRRVCRQFSIDTNASDVFTSDAGYLPRLDLAIGPYNVTTDRERNAENIMAAANNSFIREIITIAADQNSQFIENKNPRCLLSIEIEFSGSSKLIMGDFTNAGMMGHVGLIIGPSEGDMMKRIICVQDYVKTLRNLDKAPPTLFMNVACLDGHKFLQILQRFL